MCMKQIVPDYYPKFRCIAGACKHSCCIGWEIDIDEDTLQQYDAADCALSHRFATQIDRSADPAHFILGEHERCPFLNSDNLCDIILQLGEDALCDICDMHPRFRNEFSDRTEIGLGLCCEAAAQLILTTEMPVQLIVLEDNCEAECPKEDEEYLYTVRRNAIAIAQDREFSISERMEHLAAYFDFPLPKESPQHWKEIYLNLERLDENWTAALETLNNANPNIRFPQWENALEQLLVYFLHRHLPSALYDGDIVSKVAFAVLSVKLIQWLLSAIPTPTFDDLLELVRMYSSEIEYSDENPETLFDLFRE